jgi:anti-sigma regulatory factor (Ser/Thr protein kinase)
MNRQGTFPEPASLCARARFAARLDTLTEIGEWLRAMCGRGGESDAWVDMFELAVIEASSNIVRHGQSVLLDPSRESAELALTLRRWRQSWVIDLFDTGKPVPSGVFDTRRAMPSFDPEDIRTVPTGGLGLGIIHASVDVVEHRRRLGVNRLRLVKFRG